MPVEPSRPLNGKVQRIEIPIQPGDIEVTVRVPMEFTADSPQPLATLNNDGGGRGMDVVSVWATFREAEDGAPRGLQLSVVFQRPGGAGALSGAFDSNPALITLAVLLDQSLNLDLKRNNWAAQRQLGPSPPTPSESWHPYKDIYPHNGPFDGD